MSRIQAARDGTCFTTGEGRRVATPSQKGERSEAAILHALVASGRVVSAITNDAMS